MTKYGICELSLVPVRKHPSEQSEMINQLLFGDTIIIEDAEKDWFLIRTAHDMYEGWVDKKQVCILNEAEFLSYSSNTHFLSDICAVATTKNNKHVNIVMGSRLHNYSGNSITLSSINYKVICNSINNNNFEESVSDYVIDIAKQYLGSPYLWGGRSPFGIDCSGFVQIIFGMFGISLDRDSYLQAETGQTISFVSEAKKGDLAFFDNADGRIVHVGILLDNNNVIHASGKVRLDSIDHQGIYNEADKKYTHKLRIIKRII